MPAGPCGGAGRGKGRGRSGDRSETRQRCSAFWALGGRGIRGAFQLLTFQPPCRGPGTGPGRLCPRSLAPWARRAPARCRPQLHPGRAERQARPAGTGSPGGAGLAPRGGSEAAGAVPPPGPASLPPPGRPGRGPLPPAAAGPGGCSGDAGAAGGQGRSPPGHDTRGSTPGRPRFSPGGVGSGPLWRAESGRFPAGQGEETAPARTQRPRTAAPCSALPGPVRTGAGGAGGHGRGDRRGPGAGPRGGRSPATCRRVSAPGCGSGAINGYFIYIISGVP